MKLFSKIFIVTLLFIIGCSENQNINSPNIDSRLTKQNDPVYENDLDAEEATILLDLEPEWVSLPMPGLGTTQVPNYISKSKMVYKDRLNIMLVDFSYETEELDSVKLSAKLSFFPNVIQQDSLLVTAKIDTRNGTLIFEPHIQFNYPVFLDYKIEGIDVSLLSSDEIDFIFGGADGTVEPIEYLFIDVNTQENFLFMFAGKLNHFSRYGFVRRNPDF
jgi:hypothetical protein